MPDEINIKVFLRGIHEIFVSWTHLYFETCLKIFLWNPGTYRHKIVRLSSPQFGLVMKNILLLNDISKLLEMRKNLSLGLINVKGREFE